MNANQAPNQTPNPPPNPTPKRPGGEMKGGQSTEPSKSQLMPFATNAMALTSKPYFLPGVAVAIVTPLLFSFMDDRYAIPVTFSGVPVNVPVYTFLIALLLLAGGAFAIAKMVGKQRAWWTVPAVIVISACFLNTFLFWGMKGVFAAGFDEIYRGENLIEATFKATVSIGFPEELYKALAVAAGVWIARKLVSKTTPTNPLRQFAVFEPLDGILIGAAAGLGFALYETMFVYVPKEILLNDGVAAPLLRAVLDQARQGHVQLSQDFLQAVQQAMAKQSLVALIPALFAKLVGAVGLSDATNAINSWMQPYRAGGLQLTIPRLLGNLAGHSAYAGIFGYFIGLAAMKPQNWIKTVLIGLGIAAGLHGLWDAVASVGMSNSTVWFMMISFVSFAGMCTLIMKAREISPNRSQLVASQIIDRMAAGLSKSYVAPQPVAAPAAPVYRSTAASPVPAHSITYDDGPDTLTLEIGAARVPVTLGARLFERQAPGTRASRGDSVIGEINANPNQPDVLGIKNLSEQIWHVTTQEGERRELSSGRSVRLMRGMRILIGDLVAEIK